MPMLIISGPVLTDKSNRLERCEEDEGPSARWNACMILEGETDVVFVAREFVQRGVSVKSA